MLCSGFCKTFIIGTCIYINIQGLSNTSGIINCLCFFFEISFEMFKILKFTNFPMFEKWSRNKLNISSCISLKRLTECVFDVVL